MKKILILILICIVIPAYCQSIEDTKDFLKENVSNNPPMNNYDNFVFFEEDILKQHANKLAGKELTDAEFHNVFIFGQDVYLNDRSSFAFTIAQVIDIRDISKVTIIKSNAHTPHYVVSLYLRKVYHSTEYSKVLSKVEYENISRMDIRISNDKNLADKIKRAIIHLSKLYGNNVKDGDLF